MGGCQNHGPFLYNFLGTLNISKYCRSIIRIQKGTLILTTIHITLRVHMQRALGVGSNTSVFRGVGVAAGVLVQKLAVGNNDAAGCCSC